MDKGKLIPIIIAGVLLSAALIIFLVNSFSSNIFDKLIVTYSDQKYEYDDLKVDDIIVVKEVSFWVVSKNKDSIVLNSNQELLYNNKKTTEFYIKMKKTNSACFDSDNCILFDLI